MAPSKKKTDKTTRCPQCGMSVKGDRNTCPRCGKRIGGRAKTLCPSCGKPVSRKSVKCPHCGADVSTPPTHTETSPAEKADDSSVVTSVESELALLEEEEGKPACPQCGTELDKAGSSCPKCSPAIGEEHEPSAASSRSEVPPAGTVQKEAGSHRGSPSHQCPSCGSVIPKSFHKCPVCHERLAAAELRHDRSSIQGKPAETEAKAEKPKKTRKLKSARTATVLPAVTETAVSQPPRGDARAETEKEEGTPPETPAREADREPEAQSPMRAPEPQKASRRLQAGTVAVVLIVVLSTLVYLLYFDQSQTFAVDGDYADWDDVTDHSMKVQPVTSAAKVSKWAVASQSSDLFLHMATETPMMSSAGAASYYLFVDSDGSDSTGYVLESSGADYMLRMVGWNSTIYSSALYQYPPSSDRYDWSRWIPMGSISCSLDSARLEAGASLGSPLSQSAKFVLVSKDATGTCSVSYTVPLHGGVLVVEQVASTEVASDGLIPKSETVTILSLRFTCDGEGGRVEEVSPTITGAPPSYQGYLQPGFSIEEGEERKISVAVDTSMASNGQFVSAEVLRTDIDTSFACVEIVGCGASAYVGVAPSGVVVDGALADWAGRLSEDQDTIPVTSQSTDIDEVGYSGAATKTYFYLSVKDEMCSGSIVPAAVLRLPDNRGLTVISTRHTAEDVFRIFIDSDRSSSTGMPVTQGSKEIGADQLIEVKGLYGKVTSAKEYNYTSTRSWAEKLVKVDVEKDDSGMEIGIGTETIENSTDIEFVVEAATWIGPSDVAFYILPSSTVSALVWTNPSDADWSHIGVNLPQGTERSADSDDVGFSATHAVPTRLGI